MTPGTGKKGPQSPQNKRLTHCGPGPRCSLTSFPGRLFRPGPAGVFFCCGPARTLTLRVFPPGWCFLFFAAAPPGPGWCFVFCCGPARTLTHSLTVDWGDFGKARAAPPNPTSRARLVFFFAAAPRGRSLTHCGPGRRCLPPGWCFLFLAAAPPGPGWCFFFAVAPPGRSLTHCELGRFRQGPGSVFFFWLRPRRTRRANNKKCLVYYIGSFKVP